MKPPSPSLLRSLRSPISYQSQIPPPSYPYDLSKCRRRRPALQIYARHFTSSTIPRASSSVPSTSDRGPPSKEDTQTDFSSMNVLGLTAAPATSIDACTNDGFHLDNGLRVTGGCGCLLVAGEAFSWRPWDAGKREGSRARKGLVNEKGQWDVGNGAWGLLDLVWPKPDLLILGLGPSMYPISQETRKYVNSLGIRVDVQDTRNAAAQFNLLATERGVENVAAALIPIGWREPKA